MNALHKEHSALQSLQMQVSHSHMEVFDFWALGSYSQVGWFHYSDDDHQLKKASLKDFEPF